MLMNVVQFRGKYIRNSIPVHYRALRRYLVYKHEYRSKSCARQREDYVPEAPRISCLLVSRNNIFSSPGEIFAAVMRVDEDSGTGRFNFLQSSHLSVSFSALLLRSRKRLIVLSVSPAAFFRRISMTFRAASCLWRSLGVQSDLPYRDGVSVVGELWLFPLF